MKKAKRPKKARRPKGPKKARRPKARAKRVGAPERLRHMALYPF